MEREILIIKDEAGNEYTCSIGGTGGKYFFTGEMSLTITPHFHKFKVGGSKGNARVFYPVANNTYNNLWVTQEFELSIKIPYSLMDSLYDSFLKIPYLNKTVKLNYKLYNPISGQFEYPICRIESWNIRSGVRTMGTTGEMINIKLLVVDYTSTW